MAKILNILLSNVWLFDLDVGASDAWRVYDDTGELVTTGTGTNLELPSDGLSPTPPLVTVETDSDILVAPWTLAPVFAARRAIIQWRNTDAPQYAIQRADGATWDTLRLVPGAATVYLQSRVVLGPLGSDDAETWRVVPVSLRPNLDVIVAGEPLEFSLLVIGLPEPPAIKLAYTDGDVVVSVDTGSGETI